MIQWFPGHMSKTRRLISENIKLVDVVIELADARLPQSSRNPLLHDLIGEKPRLLVLAKEDLADNAGTQGWLKHFLALGICALSLNSVSRSKQKKQKLLESIRAQAAPVLKRRKEKGIINQTVRTMIVGIPNVGKSTLINFLANKGVAQTGDRPGVTKGKQWIRLENNIELLDMPGILWPKFEDSEMGYKLAACGAISDNVVNLTELALWLLQWLVKNTPARVRQRYSVEETDKSQELLAAISKRRGFLKSGGDPDIDKGAIMLIDEFRGGKLGKITMDCLSSKDEG